MPNLTGNLQAAATNMLVCSLVWWATMKWSKLGRRRWNCELFNVVLFFIQRMRGWTQLWAKPVPLTRLKTQVNTTALWLYVKITEMVTSWEGKVEIMSYLVQASVAFNGREN
jgi:hypothetical protein